MQRPTKGRSPAVRTGFTLVESLAVIGVLLVIASLALPAIRSTRATAKRATSVARIRELGLALVAYSETNRGLVPAVFAPKYRGAVGPWEEVSTPNGQRIQGAWFANGVFFYLPLDFENPEVLSAPDAPLERRIVDYKVADAYYAAPEYWNRRTQRGPQQWRAQRIADTQFPSQKGFMRQFTVYTVNGREASGFPACCTGNLRAAVLWADLSATDENQSLLRNGEPNFWHHGLSGALPLWANGVPVENTLNGIQGIDR